MKKLFLPVCFLLTVCMSFSSNALYAQSDFEDLDSLERGLEELSQTGVVDTRDTTERAEEIQSQGKNKVVAVTVKGNQIVSTGTVLSKIKTKVGMRLQQDTVNEDVRTLYATGFFQDIEMEVQEKSDGYELIVNVVEKPIVRSIQIQGAVSFKESKLRKELTIVEGQILDRKAIKAGVEAIRKKYTDKGFKFIDIDSTVNVNEASKEASVIIQIDEGEKFKISEIEFEGLKAFKDKKIQRLMKTKKKKLFSSGVFKESEFQKDLEKIRLYYQQEGYLDVKVQPEFDYNRDEQRMSIKVIVDEGIHYATGELKIEGNRLFPESEIWQELDMLPGLTYSQFYLAKDLEQIRNYYADQGHIDARVVPDVKLNRDSGKVDVTYKIEEGEVYFVEKVVVRGNTKTRDIVIRRELRIRPGDKFDGEKIRKSKQRLENLGFFEEVTYDTQPAADSSNRKDLIFRVKEKRTGELSFGGGISSVDSFVGFAEISQKNFDLFNFPRFTGDGQSLSLRGRVGSISQDFNLSFNEPYLFNKPISLGTDLFNIRRDNRNTDFDEERRGGSVTISRMFRDVIRVGTGYTLERVELSDISADAPSTVRNFAGSNWLSRVKLFASHDTRDNPFNPSKGHIANITTELVGSFLGGDQDFYSVSGSYAQYWSFFKKHILEFRTRLATAKEFGDSSEVPIFDRFYAGGLGTVRGYNFRRVGPIEGGDAIGGQTLGIINLEYTFPIPKLEQFRGAVFMDVGQVDRDSYSIDSGKAAVSIGPGVKVKTPIGPVAFYYGYPIANRDTEDKNGRFEFSLSRGF